MIFLHDEAPVTGLPSCHTPSLSAGLDAANLLSYLELDIKSLSQLVKVRGICPGPYGARVQVVVL
jgi:hypothetical protein